MEESPTHVHLRGKYQSISYDNPKFAELHAGVTIRVIDPSGVDFISIATRREGHFEFETRESGVHQFCLTINTTTYAGDLKMRFQMSIDNVGDDLQDNMDNPLQSENMGSLVHQIKRLHDQIRAISAEQDYQREREFTSRDTSESNNARTAWLSILQISFFILSAVWQIWVLKLFFKAKKLV